MCLSSSFLFADMYASRRNHFDAKFMKRKYLILCHLSAGAGVFVTCKVSFLRLKERNPVEIM